MSFEKYGHKLINLLNKFENKLTPNKGQIGGGDGPKTDASENEPYVKILSYSVNHVSVLVHLDRNGSVKELENPQISYGETENKVEEYSIEQQLRLGCDNKGNMYNYSIVLTRYLKDDVTTSTSSQHKLESDSGRELIVEKVADAGNSFGELSNALSKLSQTD